MRICGRIKCEALPASKGSLYPEATPDRGLFAIPDAQTGPRTQKVRGAMVTLDTLSNTDQALGSAVHSAFKRIRLWRVPPNWSRDDWLEEVAAVATAAAWQAVCEFNPEQGVPLAGFGYCRIISRCLAHYRKEWRYALHIAASDSCEKETSTFKHPGLAASSVAKVNGSDYPNGDLRGAVRALPAEQRQLIEQLFWEKRTETEVANTMNINQSTINRRKRTILKSIRRKLCDANEFQKFCIKILIANNLTDWLAGLGDLALGV